MDETSLQVAEGLLAAAPCSVTLPAGTGKTQLVATAAALAGGEGQRSLILTHTNAGVDAIRRRLRLLGVPAASTRVETLASWAFALTRSYPGIAGVMTPAVPNWADSNVYVQGAIAVAHARALREVMRHSFGYLLVDEYQDCSALQHKFVLALGAGIEKTVVFGDPLQAIFTFGGPMASWEDDVAAAFPGHRVPTYPHRWAGHNRDLGEWLLQLRALLQTGATFDITTHDVPGLRFVTNSDPTTLPRVAQGFTSPTESVVLLDKWAPDVARHAGRLNGRFLVMEDIGARFMHEHLAQLPEEGDPSVAHWLATFAKDCGTGLGQLDRPVLERLAQHQGVAHYRREGITDILQALDRLVQNPTYQELSAATEVMYRNHTLKLYRREAWRDTCEAIRLSAGSDFSAVDMLHQVRDRLRRTGRGPENRIASRTLLVKGLEYDHVVIADLGNFADPCNLYVALSRARKTITIVGRSPRVLLRTGA